jgi:hypothetical protein
MIKNRLEQAAPWKEEHPEVQAQFDFAGSL